MKHIGKLIPVHEFRYLLLASGALAVGAPTYLPVSHWLKIFERSWAESMSAQLPYDLMIRGINGRRGRSGGCAAIFQHIGGLLDDLILSGPAV
ncbi:hypothetical protein [Paraburkholderia phytofirmans]|uniref:hypothetical protein n=1 Tax=Paraburkholderia phytofirmans TaxID=261302 RepID=UPI0038B9EE05